MISLSKLLNEGALEKAAEDFLRQSIKGTEWDNKVFIAGGYIRDELLGKDPKDLDIMVDAPNGGIEFANWITKKVGSYSEGTNPVTFPRFGTAKFNLRGVIHNGIDLSNMDIESVMPRQETYVPGSRKPDVQFSNLKGDAERRDLSINAMYKNLSTGEYVDPTGKGMADLKAGILRTPIDPNKTFTDDPLRMLRLVRFFAKYGYKFAPNLLKSLKQNAKQLQTISKERIMEELNKMLVTVRPEKAMKLLKMTGLMDYIIPEFRDSYKMTQNSHHKHTVWQHTLHVLKNTKPELLNRLMALFHDIGKISTRQVTPKGVQFIGHEKEGAEMAARIMHNLKYPNELIKAVSLGVASHMKLKHGGNDAANISDKTLRRFKRDVGDKIESILNVIHADNISHADESSMPNQIEIVRKRLLDLSKNEPEKRKPPINGNDLRSTFGLKPGPIIGKIIGAIVDAMDETPNLSREDALEIAKNIIEKDNIKEESDIEEGVRLNYLNQEIDKLEKEWDRLDSQGGREFQQLSIMRKLEKLRSEKSRWEKLHGAVDVYDSLDEDIVQELKTQDITTDRSGDNNVFFLVHKDRVYLFDRGSDVSLIKNQIKYHPAVKDNPYVLEEDDPYSFLMSISESSPDFIAGEYDKTKKEINLISSREINPRSSLLVKKVAKHLGVKKVVSSHYDDLSGDDKYTSLKQKQMIGDVPDVGFHGTTSKELPGLLKYGLYPEEAESKSRFTTRGVEHYERVFFAASFEPAVFYAENAVTEAKSGFPIVIQLKIPDPSKIEPDYDAARSTGDSSPYDPGYASGVTSTQTGMQVSRETGKWAYKGRIPAKFFQWIYYYQYTSKKWKKAKPYTFLQLINRYGIYSDELDYKLGTFKMEESDNNKPLLKTLGGTPIKRYKNLVGKQVGSQLYVHKNYAARVIPVSLLQKATTALRKLYPDFKFNAIMLDAKTGTIRFDEAPDFDTAREPHVGKYVSIDKNNTAREGKSNNIWHHKWLWVMDDYDGFDVEKSKKWSETWLSKVPEVAKGTDASFGLQLKQIGLKETIDINSLKWEPERYSGLVPLDLDVKKVDDSWKNQTDLYVGVGGAGSSTINKPRYEGFKEFLLRGEPIIMPRIGYNTQNNHIEFGNGRHRFAVLRDMGLRKIPAMIPKEQEDFFKKNFTESHQPFTSEIENVGLSEDLKSEDDGYYYHVTMAPYAAAIRRNGLKTKGINPTISNYKEYSRGKTFFTDVGALDWWIYKIAEHAFHEFDDEQFHDVAVFRIKKNKLNDVQIDPEGSTDSKGESFYITYDVPPSVIEFVKIEKSPY